MMAMGQAAYLGVGAYVAAILNILLGVNFYLALLAAAIVSAFAAAVTLLPLLRIGGFLLRAGDAWREFRVFRHLPQSSATHRRQRGSLRSAIAGPARLAGSALRHDARNRDCLRAIVPAHRGVAARARAAGDARPAGCARRARQGSSALSDDRLDASRQG